MRYASLASGSSGNCHAINDGERILLVDAGISLLQIHKRLDSLGWLYDQVQALAISHEHTDHSKALPVILRKTEWAILATCDTLKYLENFHQIEIPKTRWVPLAHGRSEDWEGWRVCPFAVPHDATDPVAYRIEAANIKLAVMTDFGHATALAVEYAKGLDLLVIESNHDIVMLREGMYPDHLKARILSRVGHLSNDACADFLDKVISPSLKNIVLAHLSEQNNDPALARLASCGAISRANLEATLHVASQRETLELEV
jgi:phosphoribosyl 1,2-cyclic phosphodiesterase